MAEEVAGPACPKQTLACVLKGRMGALGITAQVDLAARMGLGLTKVNAWLRGKGRLPKATELDRIGQALGCVEDIQMLRSLIAAAKPARRRRVKFKGFIHGDGI